MRAARFFLRRFRRDARGLSAIEFALVLPVMVTFFLGAVEVSTAMIADRKMSNLASTLADLVAQDDAVSSAEMTQIFDAAASMLYPMDPAAATMRVSSVVADAAGVTRVAWSDGRNIAARAANSIYTMPQANMVPPGGSVIVAEVTLTYRSPVGEFMIAGISMADQFMLRPRRSLVVARLP